MPDDHDFLTAITSHPHDEDTRKVYGDYLKDQNQPCLAAVLEHLDELVRGSLERNLTLAVEKHMSSFSSNDGSYVNQQIVAGVTLNVRWNGITIKSADVEFY